MSFTDKDEILNETDPEEAYRRRNNEEKTAISYGQRKLLMTLISFLVNHCLDVANPTVVYAGAAPGVNIGIAASLFPQFTFHCYDPAKFAIKTDVSKKIITYQKKFTDELAEYWAEKNKQNQNIIFISDIRTADYTQAKDLEENEHQILSDMMLQKKWVEIIKPMRTQLKFRLPYAIPEISDELEYFDGIIYKQCFSPQSSSETRLVLTSSDLKYKTYSCKKYESQMFYHNVVVREKNKYEGLTDGHELLNDWDSQCEVHIWRKYVKYSNNLLNNFAHNEDDHIKVLSRDATEKLNKDKKHKDTLEYLRSHPRAIKDRNFNSSKNKKK